MAASLPLLCLAAMLSYSAPARAARSRDELALDLHQGDGGAGQKRCGWTNAKIAFPTITIHFFIQERLSVGQVHTAHCGHIAGNPYEKVLFECIEAENGDIRYQSFAGKCKSKEEVARESIPRCGQTKITADWTVNGKEVPLVFDLRETPNPTGEDMAVTFGCPEGSPGAGAEVQFTCRKNGTWTLPGGMEATKPCLALAEEVRPSDPDVKPVEGALPCKFELQHVQLVDNEAGFELLLTCSEPITDAKIKAFQGGRDLLFSVNPRQRTRITTQKVADFVGRTLVLEAKAAGALGSLSVKVAEEAPPPEGSLPCKLSREDVTLTTQEPGFQILLECTKKIGDAVLKYPDGIRSKRFGDVPNGRYALLTERTADFQGKSFVLTGKFQGRAAATNAVEV